VLTPNLSPHKKDLVQPQVGTWLQVDNPASSLLTPGSLLGRVAKGAWLRPEDVEQDASGRDAKPITRIQVPHHARNLPYTYLD